MPRPNLPRSIAGESALARRMAYERESRGWSYEGLASRMTEAGCPINTSALHKIEKGTPRRRITVDEHLALSAVFKLSMRELLRPPESVVVKEVGRLLDEMQTAVEATLRADAAYKDSLRRLAEFLIEHPNVSELVPALDAFTLVDVIETLRETNNDVDQRLAERVERVAQLATKEQ